ncbi:MAG: restriction endonuclease subunit S [Parerythrobacter sp.]
MSFPAYSEYKDSGVEWLGSVPCGWEIKRLGSQFAERREAVNDTDYPPLSVTKKGIVPQLENAAKTDANDNRKRVAVNDFAINSRSDRKNSAGVSSYDGSVSLIYTVLQPRQAVNPNFIHYLLRTTEFAEEFYRYGHGIVADLWTTRYSEMKAVLLAIPPQAEQQGIAAFLDRETAKIDAAVAAQERLIALLAEKRAATISHAVTKGLDPDAPMKDSGIEWLGQIPAHWNAVQLRHWGCFGAGSGFPHEFQGKAGNTFPFHKVGSLGKADLEGVLGGSLNTVSAEIAGDLRATVFPEGTIVYAKIGAALLLARIRVLGRPSCIDNNMAAFLPGLRTSTDYARYAFQLVRFDLMVNPGAVPSLNEASMKALTLPLPPLDEQTKIHQALDAMNRQFSGAMSKAAKAVELLKERRAALISAATTGKIDVRGEVALDNVVSLDEYRAAVGAAAIDKIGKMGRMAVMKAGYLAEAHARMHELHGHYERNAAGPYCATVIGGMENGASVKHGITVTEFDGERTSYTVPAGFSPPTEDLRAQFGSERVDRFQALLDQLSGLGREGVEAIATLYAAWNDLLAQGKNPTDEAIHREVLENWHAEKRERFNADKLAHWMDWMRRNGIVPDGTAPRTDHQTSFSL